MREVATQAVEYARVDALDVLIELPQGITYRGRRLLSVREAIESMRLEAFIE